MPHTEQRLNLLEFTSVELGGITYAIVPAAALAAVCRKAGIRAAPRSSAPPLDAAAPEQLDGADLARRIVDRRKAAGLTQAELAQRADVRVETVNRIERGHVTPDFGTIRKLVQAMLAAEGGTGTSPRRATQAKEKTRVH